MSLCFFKMCHQIKKNIQIISRVGNASCLEIVQSIHNPKTWALVCLSGNQWFRTALCKSPERARDLSSFLSVSWLLVCIHTFGAHISGGLVGL